MVEGVLGMLEEETVREEMGCGREEAGDGVPRERTEECRPLGVGIEGRGPVGGG